MTRGLLPRLIALLVVIVIGFYYVLTNVLSFSFGNGPFDVSLQLPRGGGIYSTATVTYNGVKVGDVKDVDVTPDGVVLTLALEHGTDIPSDVDANVRQLSAVGEQYVDLVPASDNGQRLRAGSVIPASRTTVPVQIGTALNDLGATLDSLDAQNLATVRSFLTTGFTGTGPDLRTLISTSQQLTRALSAATPNTVDLITHGLPVLQTLNATNSDLAAWTSNLNQVTATLKSSDADLRRLLAEGGPATEQLTALLSKTRDDIAGTITGLGSGSQVVLQYEPQLQRVFQMLPVVAQDLRSVTEGGQLRGTLLINGSNTVCSYLPSASIPSPTERTDTLDTGNRCDRSAPDLLQRGEATAPGAGRPVTPPTTTAQNPKDALLSAQLHPAPHDVGDRLDDGAVEGGDTAEMAVDLSKPSPSEEPLPDAGAPAGPRGPSRLRRLLTWGRGHLLGLVAGLVILALAVGLVLTTLTIRSDDALDDARASALQAGKDSAVAIGSYDYRTLDQDFGKVTERSTPAFRDSFNQTSTSLRKVLTDYNATAKSTVVAAGVTSATKDRAVVLVFLNQEATNTNQKAGPTTDQSRVEVTLVKPDGRWLIDAVKLL